MDNIALMNYTNITYALLHFNKQYSCAQLHQYATFITKWTIFLKTMTPYD